MSEASTTTITTATTTTTMMMMSSDDSNSTLLPQYGAIVCPCAQTACARKRGFCRFSLICVFLFVKSSLFLSLDQRPVYACAIESSCLTLLNESCTPFYQCFLPEHGLFGFIRFTRSESNKEPVSFTLHNDSLCRFVSTKRKKKMRRGCCVVLFVRHPCARIVVWFGEADDRVCVRLW
jgi:hypothetical protein